MAYHVKLRSQSEPIVLTDSKGQTLFKGWLDGTLPERVQVSDDLVISSSRIEEIRRARETSYPQTDTRDLTPEERTLNLKRLAKMKEELWGKFPSQRENGHYTEAHRLIKCTCFSPDQWPQD